MAAARTATRASTARCACSRRSATSGSGYTLEELSAQTAIPKSTLHRTLAALKARGFAAQPRPGGPYTLGPQLLAVAFGFHERLDVRGLIHPLLVRARDQFGETVHMGVLDGADVVYLDKVESLKPLKMTSVIGGRNPAPATALSKALLAWTLPDDAAVSAWLDAAGPLAARTPNTLVEPARLARRAGADPRARLGAGVRGERAGRPLRRGAGLPRPSRAGGGDQRRRPQAAARRPPRARDRPRPARARRRGVRRARGRLGLTRALVAR